MIDLSNKPKMNDVYPFIEESIKDGGQFVFYPSGTSMLPTIIPNEDCVVLIEPKDIKKYDLVLFTRLSGTYVLHRIIGIQNGEYTIMGDNQNWTEKISANQVIAKVSKIRKKNGKVLTDAEFSSLKTVIMLKISKFLKRAVNKLGRIIRGKK